MTTNLQRLLLVPVWIAAVWGSLQIHRMDLNLGHSICGAWGCGPPVEALIGYHGFWTLMVLPIAVGLGLYLSAATSRKVGVAVVLFGLVAICIHVGWDAFTYANRVGSAEYLIQRALFILVTSVDLPMIPTVLAGSLLAFGYGRKSRMAPAVAESDIATLEVASPFASDT